MLSPLLILAVVFVSVGVMTGAAVWPLMTRNTAERKRLEELTRPGTRPLGPDVSSVLDPPAGAAASRVKRLVPKSPAEMRKLRKRLARAGYHSMTAAIVYASAELILPLTFGLVTLAFVGMPRGLFALLAAGVGYVLPSLVLERMITKRKKLISNGLPDALDLIIVCLEAGNSLDQAIVKVTEELAIAHPALAEEFRLLNIETRAGKPRLEAFRNLASRTDVDDVRSLVSMLVQTDRFGTSVGQALRVHAATSRTKRRQRAEEKAGKIGVKLVFPLVFCLFPAFYVVTLGPAVIDFMRFFAGQH